jgi:two-component system chemotaxis response regulator CheB
MALRALEEKSELSRRLAAADSHRHSGTGKRFRSIAVDADVAGATIRQLIARIGAAPHADAVSGPATNGEHPAGRPSDVR